jgi:tRNA A37 threonylcarbamoyladenosine synthetase subunit TsaC/SUA5/YrdC
MARRIVLEPGGDWSEGLADWERVLRAGGIVGFATDTVWGIGALASRGSTT